MKWAGMRHVLIIGLLIVLIETSRHVLGMVDLVSASVVSSRIDEGSPARGASSPVVVISYEFIYRGSRWVSSDTFQPRRSFGRMGWTAEERTTAQRYVAERPVGTPVRVAVSKFYPWSNRVLNGTESPAPNRFGPSWAGLAVALLLYVLGVTAKLGLRALRTRKRVDTF
jgi:hypothetical protein